MHRAAQPLIHHRPPPGGPGRRPARHALVQHRICGPARGPRKFRRIPADPPLARSV